MYLTIIVCHLVVDEAPFGIDSQGQLFLSLSYQYRVHCFPIQIFEGYTVVNTFVWEHNITSQTEEAQFTQVSSGLFGVVYTFPLFSWNTITLSSIICACFDKAGKQGLMLLYSKT